MPGIHSLKRTKMIIMMAGRPVSIWPAFIYLERFLLLFKRNFSLTRPTFVLQSVSPLVLYLLLGLARSFSPFVRFVSTNSSPFRVLLFSWDVKQERKPGCFLRKNVIHSKASVSVGVRISAACRQKEKKRELHSLTWPFLRLCLLLVYFST